MLADWAARHGKGGRIRVQSLGLILGAPFVFLAGWSESFPVLVACSRRPPGLCKGVYDANIFASLFDVVRPEERGIGGRADELGGLDRRIPGAGGGRTCARRTLA